MRLQWRSATRRHCQDERDQGVSARCAIVLRLGSAKAQKVNKKRGKSQALEIRWGSLLRRACNETADPHERDATLRTLTFSTTNGAVEYYAKTNMTKVFLHAARILRQQHNLPVHSAEIDSYFYYLSDCPLPGAVAMKNWTTRPDIFPPSSANRSALQLIAETGFPLLQLHNRHFDNNKLKSWNLRETKSTRHRTGGRPTRRGNFHNTARKISGGGAARNGHGETGRIEGSICGALREISSVSHPADRTKRANRVVACVRVRLPCGSRRNVISLTRVFF